MSTHTEQDYFNIQSALFLLQERIDAHRAEKKAEENLVKMINTQIIRHPNKQISVSDLREMVLSPIYMGSYSPDNYHTEPQINIFGLSLFREDDHKIGIITDTEGISTWDSGDDLVHDGSEKIFFMKKYVSAQFNIEDETYMPIQNELKGKNKRYIGRYKAVMGEGGVDMHRTTTNPVYALVVAKMYFEGLTRITQ